ncbi:EAL domain-containing protein (putative c-di-GMP-specific phosphodiesterase class I) [Arthrobacter sp. B2I5]|nr:EAL domain-containing protein (putative c-di-GMP-specific phosphodiesterase class I) [Arthrobacter sp. B2I5]
MSEDPRAADLVTSIIVLAQSLGLTVVAEGVENAQRLDQLTLSGCDQAQGFYISKPLPASDLNAWLTRDSPEPNPPWRKPVINKRRG